MSSTWVLGTQNTEKVREFQALFQSHGIEIIPYDLGFDVEESGQTFHDNALLKARAFAQASGKPALADDSGLAVEALDGAPGVLSARWAGPHQDYPCAFKMLEESLVGIIKPRAAFVCVVCLWSQDQEPQFFEGQLQGHIQFPPMGENGFGYDPIFVPDGYDITLAQMSMGDKNQISHRSQAIQTLMAALFQ